MTALYIVGGIAAFIAFLLACPVTLRAAFRDEFSARAGYLFFHYTIAPRPPRKKEAKPPKEEKPEKSKLRLLLEQKGLSGFLSILQEAAKIASGMAKRLFSHFSVNPFRLDIAVAGDDAARTAVTYGHVCGIVGTASSLLLGNVKCKNCKIRVTPDFLNTKSRVQFEAEIRVRLFFLLAAGLFALFRSIRLIRRVKTG
jgi:hypothetical protein